MEVETMYRYKLPIVIIIVNNGGIYGGFDAETYQEIRSNGDLSQMYVYMHAVLFAHLFYIGLCPIQWFYFILFFRTPPTALTVEARYEAMSKIFGHTGYFVKTIPELRQSLSDALQIKDRPTILNVIIGPSSDRKEQSFNWLTESKL